jgi:WhiB family transcriptional regulator, redox-sensing transcriptional regulator
MSMSSRQPVTFAELRRETDWMARAACRKEPTETFFTDHPGRALAICEACPSRRPCLEYAMQDPNIVGTWGGTTTGERRLRRLIQSESARA